MTAIYKTGTVSVNNGSNIVTGNGTSFIDIANTQLGDLFTVDGQKFYEIYAVDTNTQIKIRNIVTGGAFAETNVTAGNFAIIRNFTSQTSAEIAGKVLAVQQKWMNREEEMTDWFYTANDWATVTSINGDQLSVMTPNGINNLLGTAAGKDVTTSATDTTANRVLKVADGGLLSTGNAPSIVPGANIHPTMFARDGDGGGGYPVFGFASSILNMRYNANRQAQLAFNHNGFLPRAVFRTMVSDNVWTDTFDLFGEHNANFTVFGGNGADDRVANAVGRNTANAFANLHLNSNVPAVGLIVTGTFRLVDSLGTTTLVSGLSQSNFSLSNAKPSNKLFSVLISFPTASVSKDLPMYLETESADAKIEVTF